MALDKKQIEAICIDTINGHRASFEELKKRWEGLMARYENKLREDSISADTESKVALGGAFALVENALPRIFSRDPKYKYLGREGKDMADAEAYQEFSEYQWQEAEAKTNIKEIARWGLATGLAGWKMGWKEETIIHKKKGKEVLGVQITNPLAMATLDKLKLGKDIKVDDQETTANYTLMPIPPHKLIWSVESTRLNQVRVFGHSERRRVSELKSQGYDVSKLIAEIKVTDKFKDKVDQMDGMSVYAENKLALEEYVDVAELYTKILNEQNIYEYHIVHMANPDSGQPVTIRFESTPLDRPFIPMGIFRPIDRLGKFYGFGMIEPAAGVLDAEEDTLNMSMEAVWVAINPPVEYNPQNMLSLDTLEYRARTLNPVRALGQSMAVMPTPQLPTGSVSFMQAYLQKAKQNITGITDYQTGADQAGGGKTAFEVNAKTQESNQRMRFIIENFEEQVILPIGRYALYFNQQYLADKPKIFYRIVGRKGTVSQKAIKFKDIEAIKDLAIVPGSTSMLNEQEEIAKWERLIASAQNEAKMGPDAVPINREPMFERLFENGYNIKDAENYIPSLKEREEKSVTSDVAQLDDAEQESDNPAVARVLPTDNHQLHLQIHQAVAKSGMKSDGQPLSAEEQLMLSDHINAHTQAMGGVVPAFSQQVSQAAGQQINAMANPQEANQ